MVCVCVVVVVVVGGWVGGWGGGTCREVFCEEHGHITELHGPSVDTWKRRGHACSPASIRQHRNSLRNTIPRH